MRIHQGRRTQGEIATLVVATWSETRAADASEHLVLPDASMDLIWTGSKLLLSGPESRAVIWREKGATFVGLRLRAGVASALFGVPAHQLTDRRIQLEDLWGVEAAQAADRLATASSPEAELEAIVRERARSAPRMDPLVPFLIRRLSARGVADVAREAGLSERQLRRRCLNGVGFSPKRLARVLRLRRMLELASLSPLASLASLASAARYADQAHMTRECRRLTGLTPVRLIHHEPAAG